jgi:hypothetical protein
LVDKSGDRNLNPVLYQGDIAILDFPGKLSAIVVAWGSFMLLENRFVFPIPKKFFTTRSFYSLRHKIIPGYTKAF